MASCSSKASCTAPRRLYDGEPWDGGTGKHSQGWSGYKLWCSDLWHFLCLSRTAEQCYSLLMNAPLTITPQATGYALRAGSCVLAQGDATAMLNLRAWLTQQPHRVVAFPHTITKRSALAASRAPRHRTTAA